MIPAKRSSGGASPRPYAAEAGWRTWLVELGRQVRRVREFLGLSQDQLARLAGVSQGAVSRFESGRGLQTPFLTILRIHLVLANGLRRLDPELLTDDARRLLRYTDLFPPASEVEETAGPGERRGPRARRRAGAAHPPLPGAARGAPAHRAAGARRAGRRARSRLTRRNQRR